MAATKQQNDITKTMQEFMGAFPVDTKAVQDAFKTSASLNAKLSNVVLETAGQSNDITAKWTKDTLAKMGALTSVKDDPADYGKAMTDFASAQAEITSNALAAFAEVAKKVQTDNVELMTAAGKDFSEDATKAVKKATDDVTTAAKKAGSNVTAATAAN